MCNLSKEASNTMEVIKMTLLSNHKHRDSWWSLLENVDKCVNSTIVSCAQGQNTNYLSLLGPGIVPVVTFRRVVLLLLFAHFSGPTWF